MCSYSADCRDVKLDCCGHDPCPLCPILRRRRLSLLLNNCVPLVPRLVHLILPLIQRPLLVREPNCDIQSCHMTAQLCGLALFDCPWRQSCQRQLCWHRLCWCSSPLVPVVLPFILPSIVLAVVLILICDVVSTMSPLVQL